jgi:hypothetical protein
MSLNVNRLQGRPGHAGNHVQKINQENEKKSRKKNSYLKIVKMDRDFALFAGVHNYSGG